MTVPSGEEFVFLPRKEYEALIDALDDALEELADIVTCDRVKAELAEDPDGVLPADLSALTLNGHRSLAAIRIWRALEIEDLASKSNVKPADIVAGVRGGKMYGRWPGLANDALDQGADLAVTTDYRSVLAEIMSGHMGYADRERLFPGFEPGTLGVMG